MPRRTPRQRLQDILDAIESIEDYTEGKGIEDFRANPMIKDAVERNIERISEASRHLPDEPTDRHADVPWDRVRDIGNVLRHAYDQVDDRVIWDVVDSDLGPLKEAIESMIADLEGPKRG